MFIPSGGNRFRQANFFLPVVFDGKPTITMTIASDLSPGPVFIAWQATVVNVQNNTHTQIKVSAENVHLEEHVNIEFTCDIVVVGQRATGHITPTPTTTTSV